MIKIEPNRICEQDKMQLNTYQQLEQQYLCRTTSCLTWSVSGDRFESSTMGIREQWPVILAKMWRARRELNPGPPGLLRQGKSLTECTSPVLYLTELRAPQLTKRHWA